MAMQKVNIADHDSMSPEEFAAAIGYSTRTVERMIKNGTGPKITKIGPRKRRIMGKHYREWLEALASTDTPEAA
jgi:predicted DNA-binding transcriptional regulator AlpA